VALCGLGRRGENGRRQFRPIEQAGGQGVVYLSTRRGSDNFTLPVALKIFSPERYASEQAYGEAMNRIAAVAARVAQIQEDRRRGELRYLDVERAKPEVLRSRRPIVDRRVDEANPFEGRVEDVPAPANTEAPQPGWKPRTEEMPEPAAEPAPASDDPFVPSANSRQDARDELRASSRENVAEQTDGRLEREATELENTLEQRDAQQEFEAAR
jgi:hypothetical protein